MPSVIRDEKQSQPVDGGSLFGLGRLLSGNISVPNLFGSRQPEAPNTPSPPGVTTPDNPRSWYKRAGFSDFIEHAQGGPKKRQRVASIADITAADSPFNNSRRGAVAPLFVHPLPAGYDEMGMAS